MKDLNHYMKQFALFLLDVSKRLDPSLFSSHVDFEHVEGEEPKGAVEEPNDEETFEFQQPEPLFSAPSDESASASEEATEESAPSLLDNKPYMALVHQCRDMIQELDRIYKLVPDEQSRSFIEQQQSRIAEALFLSGATPIAEEPTFNLLRHEPVYSPDEGSHSIATNGVPIAETITPGIELEGLVLVKAKVKLIQVSHVLGRAKRAELERKHVHFQCENMKM